MKTTPYPGYEKHLNLYQIIAHGTEEEKAAAREEQRRSISEYTLPKGMTMEDMTIPGGSGQDMTIRVYKPANIPANSPMILEVHGGNWVGGSLDIDNYRCITLACGTPAIVIGVDYRLTSPGGVHYPDPLMDCHAALQWIAEHAEELGGDPKRIGLHGTSAGANLCAGLALYVRDHGGPEIALAVLNCPILTLGNTISKQQYAQFTLAPETKKEAPEMIYLGEENWDGLPPSYAFPGHHADLEGLCPHFVVVGEYDTLRDDGIKYAARLLETGVPCELLVAPRVGHGFCVMDLPLTHWVHKGICASYRRQFGMEITEF